MATGNPSRRPSVARDQTYKASVLDRLISRDDDSSRVNSGPQLRDVRESVRRDLEDLLNTRPCCESGPPHPGDLADSLVNYGLPDFTGAYHGGPANRELLRRLLEKAIESYEPRLRNVKVDKITKGQPSDRTLVFRIEARLRVDPISEDIAFESTIEPLSASFAVTRA